MKKITLLILMAIACFSMHAQIANTTGITGDDLIYHEDGRTTGASGYTINITGPATVATNGGTKPANDAEAGYTRPANNYDNGVTSTADYGATLKTNNVSGGANTASTMWYVINSVDLAAYDGTGSKYFTIVTLSTFFENGSDNIDDQNEFWYRNSATGADPTTGGAWTKIPSGLISSHANGVLGADATWVATKIDLSSITCGDGFAIALKRTTSADGPNPSKTAFGSSDNRNGSFYVSSNIYTGTPAPAALIDVAAGDFSALNTSSTSQGNIFKTPTASIDNANFSNTSKWADVLTTTGSVPRLVNGALAPVGEGYKFEVAAGYNPIVVSEVRYLLVNAASNKGGPAGSIWIVQGSNDDTNWDDLSDPVQMFSTNTGNEYPIQLTSTKAYRYFRFVLNTAWTPNSNFTALQQLDFTVAALWTGTTNSDWDTTTNWNTNALPIASHDAIIPSGITNYPTITGTITTNNITIESGASLVTNGATVNSNVTYKRQLSTPTPTGTFATDKLEGWHLISSPVLNQALNDTFISENGIASGSGTNKGVSTYTEATNTWDYFEDAETFTFVKGQGYSVKRTATGNVTFNGNLHLSDVATPNLARTADGFHLVGNPYPAYISSEQFLDNNTTVSDNKTIWVWNDGSNSYDTHISTADFKIAPGQAFFVQVNTSGGTLTFAESNQAHNGTDTFLRTEVKPEITLNITDGNLKRYAKVYYNNNATKSFDSGYDGEIFGGITTPFEVYSQLLENNQGKNYQIQSLPNTDLEAMVVPVGLKAENGKEITFSAEALNIPAGLKVFLEDRNSNTFTRLDEANSEYKVTLTEAVNGIGRFYLHTRSSALSTKDVVLENISIYKTNNTNLKIVGLQQGAASVKLFNVLGKQVMSASFNTNGVQDVSLPNLATGVYIVQLSTENGKLNKKIILE